MFQMAKSSNQKTKLLFLMKYLLEATDEMHPASLADLLAMLERHGIRAERKSIYDDLEALRLFGLDIEFQKAQPADIMLPAGLLNCRNSNCWWMRYSLQNLLRIKRPAT